MEARRSGIWQPELVVPAIRDAVYKLSPRTLWRNPVMLVVEIGSVLTTVIAVRDLFVHGAFGFDLHISIWLWFTVLFANFAEAVAEGRGKAQAESLRKARNGRRRRTRLPSPFCWRPSP